ncbi:hypothetical protein [Maribacter hydrothermalis]|uniref:Uncharacterized protein n=1 Tax=Maribacter hydrothermalis TaxID=1836467 RepID=A0A1B7ZCH7_9FLAO|nr:hypothetical protein [Maribacter hydrothermalis]APQ18611.1 hypothetical protein BTR34_15365 [Maribacter hydrothermalis]OBR40833.1 hypothetical protein A9200_14685 [Maribacter hydrothermalis]
MLFNTSYLHKEYTKESVRVVGEAFSFSEMLKLGVIGSGRLIIKELITKLRPKNLQLIAINYSNIELRPKGIVVHSSPGLDRYSWIIPYYRLVNYNTQTFSIHSNGNFIKFSRNRNYLDNKKFIDKMSDFKNNFLNLTYYDS